MLSRPDPIPQELVRLPGEEWISQHDVLNAIADAIHPDRRRAKGADLITRKVMDEDHPVGGLQLFLSDDDVKLLKKLPGASKLRPDSSDEDWETFVRVFKHRHPKKARLWTPGRPTELSLYADYAARGHVIGPHLQQIQQWIATKDIAARDAVSAGTTRIDAHTELLRTDVEKYLKWVGIRYVVGNAPPPPLYPVKKASRVQVRVKRGEPSKWTGDLLGRLKKLANEIPRQTNKQIAEQLGESEAQVAKVRRKIEREPEQARWKKLSSSNLFGIRPSRGTGSEDD